MSKTSDQIYEDETIKKTTINNPETSSRVKTRFRNQVSGVGITQDHSFPQERCCTHMWAFQNSYILPSILVGMCSHFRFGSASLFFFAQLPAWTIPTSTRLPRGRSFKFKIFHSSTWFLPRRRKKPSRALRSRSCCRLHQSTVVLIRTFCSSLVGGKLRISYAITQNSSFDPMARKNRSKFLSSWVRAL